MYITVVRDERIRKKLKHKEGKFIKEPTANLSEYTALVVLATLEMIFNAISSGLCTIITGYIPGVLHMQYITLLSKNKFNEIYQESIAPITIGGKLISMRTKDIFVHSAIFLLDFDVDKYTPDRFRNLSPAEYIDLLSSIFPEFIGVGYVFNYGSSAGIFTADGVELKAACGFHIYIKSKCAFDIDRFISVLYAKLILAGFYWKNDAGKIYTLIDKSATSRERFCFEVNPLLFDGLVRNVPEPKLIQGSELDTVLLPDLTQDELQLLATILQVKNVAISGLPVVTSNQSLKLSKHDNKLLKPDTIITLSDNTQITVKDFYESPSSDVAKPCYAPFRNDKNPSAFITKHNKVLYVVYIYDSSIDITYFCDLSTDSHSIKRFEDAEATIDHLSTLFTLIGITTEYDMIKKDIDVVVPGHDFLPDNKANATLAIIYSLVALYGFKISESKLMKYLVAIADKNRRNPVKDWIESVPWDGKDRLTDLADCLVTTPKYEAFKLIALRRWLIGCVASAFSITGCKNEIIFILCGEQGIGKTTFFVSLVPALCDWIKDGFSLNTQDKDSVKLCVSYWIVELGELEATFKKSAIALLKAFMSMTSDELRLPYAPVVSKYPRRTAFCASVNTPSFLVDDTGNRRFSPIHVTEVRRHTIDIQQLWAQVLTLYNAGEQWWYTDDEAKMQTEINLEHQAIDPLEELLTNHYDFANKPYSGLLLNPTGVMQDLGYKAPSRSDTTRMGNILKAKGLVKTGKKYRLFPISWGDHYM